MLVIYDFHSNNIAIPGSKPGASAMTFSDPQTLREFREGRDALLEIGARRVYLEDDGASYVARIYAPDGSFFQEYDYRDSYFSLSLFSASGKLIAVAETM